MMRSFMMLYSLLLKMRGKIMRVVRYVWIRCRDAVRDDGSDNLPESLISGFFWAKKQEHD